MLAYLDCFSGISGDMALGALVDLGLPLEWLQQELEQIPLSGFTLRASSVERHGISACQVKVSTKAKAPSRTYADIKALIENSALAPDVKERSLEIFTNLAAVESQIHNCALEAVHFHEVGGVDAIVDIVGTCLGLSHLGITQVNASRLPLGSGFVQCQHGSLPVPSPATVALLKGVPVYGTDIDSELVTPTGAALVTGLASSFGPIPPVKMVKVGYGAGSRDIPTRPNLLRILCGHTTADSHLELQDEIMVVETSIDDMNPEFYSFLVERLFELGVLDVYMIPVFMKKNRPGTLLQALCPIDRYPEISRHILTETTSIGVRHYPVQRQILKRRQVQIDTSFGPVEVKEIVGPEGEVRRVPEFEVCRKIARERGKPLRVIYERILQEASSPNT